MNFFKSINMNSARAIYNFARAISAHVVCLWAGFSSPAQASFFLICAGDSAGVMPRPEASSRNTSEAPAFSKRVENKTLWFNTRDLCWATSCNLSILNEKNQHILAVFSQLLRFI